MTGWARRPLNAAGHARRPGIVIRGFLGSASTSPAQAKSAALRLARLVADLRKGIIQQTPGDGVLETAR